MTKPQPIETAPRDGTVILSDCGCVTYLDQRNWGSPVPNGWAECSPCGDPDSCADDGIRMCSPKLWMPLPEWMK